MSNTGDDNTGDDNTGKHNTGHSNTGNYNTGWYNTGYYNTGWYNTRSHNTGHSNTGYYNTGSYNTGFRNTGYYNTGNYNTGAFNKGSNNTGHFNTDTPTVRMFNKDTGLMFDQVSVPYVELPLTEWIPYNKLPKEQQTDEAKTCGGVLISRTYHEAWALVWEKMNEKTKQKFKDLPNFCPKIFKEITGIDLEPTPEEKVEFDRWVVLSKNGFFCGIYANQETAFRRAEEDDVVIHLNQTVAPGHRDS